MSGRLLDAGGRELARIFLDPPRVVSDDAELASWGTRGCPSLRGEQQGDAIVEVPSRVAPDDFLWPLAVLREAERRGWTVEAGPADVREARAAWRAGRIREMLEGDTASDGPTRIGGTNGTDEG